MLYQAGGSRGDRYDDGDSAMLRAGLNNNQNLWAGNPLGDRVGVWQLDPNDARYRLDKLRMSQILEEQGAPGPRCLAPRIMGEPPPPGAHRAPGVSSGKKIGVAVRGSNRGKRA